MSVPPEDDPMGPSTPPTPPTQHGPSTPTIQSTTSSSPLVRSSIFTEVDETEPGIVKTNRPKSPKPIIPRVDVDLTLDDDVIIFIANCQTPPTSRLIHVKVEPTQSAEKADKLPAEQQVVQIPKQSMEQHPEQQSVQPVDQPVEQRLEQVSAERSTDDRSEMPINETSMLGPISSFLSRNSGELDQGHIGDEVLPSTKADLDDELPEYDPHEDLDWQQDPVSAAREAAELAAQFCGGRNKAQTINEDLEISDAPANTVEEDPQIHGDDSMDWMKDAGDDPETEAAEAAKADAAFAKLQKAYRKKVSKGTTTISDDVTFGTAETENKRRLTLLKSKNRMDDETNMSEQEIEGDGEDHSMFVPAIPVAPTRRPKSVAKHSAALSNCEMMKNMAAGLQAFKEKNETTKKLRKESKPRKKNTAGRIAKKPKKPRGPNMANLSSLGSTHSIIQQAQANQNKPAQPTFSEKNKDKALKELLSSIPSAERAIPNSDKNALLAASKKFNGTGSVKSDGHGGWKLKGMTSSLHNHQLLGAAWMRDRENGDELPRGGIVADEMGFGKTIQALANIVGGAAGPNDRVKTTLIVVPSSLVQQWEDEIKKHCDMEALGTVRKFCAGHDALSSDPVADLQSNSIVLTTYSSIRTSYPNPKPPMHLVTDPAKNAWWQKHYLETVGPLHRMKWRRIILDESHCIKNAASATSIAVRQLTGMFRWCISGTPITNFLEEFYSTFAFLKVPHTGDWPTFFNNYINNRVSKNSSDYQRMNNMLRAIVLRRTHEDVLFRAPIVKLPGIEHKTIEVEFNSVERAVYNLVKTKFIQFMNTYSRKGALKLHYRGIFAMMLKLRQLCGHILLVQSTLKELLVVSDVEALWRRTASEAHQHGENLNTKTFSQLREMLKSFSGQRTTLGGNSAIQPIALSPNVEDEEEEPESGQSFGLEFKFRRYLQQLRRTKTWAELWARSFCAKCKNQPEKPYCTSCYHVYCKECLDDMGIEAAREEAEHTACLECGTVYTEATPCFGLRELGFNSTPITHATKGSPKPTKKRRKKGTPATDSADSEESEDIDWITVSPLLPSAKTTATKAQLINWFRQAPDTKVIIYTQFLDMVRILSRMCNIEGWGYVTFTGQLSFEARNKNVQQFRDKPDIKIMICSLRAGGVGLNLTMANKVIILDLWFNSAVEAQAYCRVFRINQEKKVEVVRFVVNDSIDQDLINLQDRKQVEIDSVMGQESLNKRATIEELVELFGKVKEEGGNEFIFVEDEEAIDDDDKADFTTRLPPRPF